MLRRMMTHIRTTLQAHFDILNQRVTHWTTLPRAGLVTGTVTNLTRSKAALIAENALLRQQLSVLHRHIARPHLQPWDRFLLVVLASKAHLWRSSLLIVQPETLLRWHRLGLRLFWRARSQATPRTPRVPEKTVALIVVMAQENRLWGAERIRGELLKLGVHVSKATILKYMRRGRPPRRRGQTWATFLRAHASEVWACDFIQLTDVSFRSLFAFVIVEHASQRVVHIGVTRHPTAAWTTQQPREATPFGTAPRFLIHDNDAKFGTQFEQVAVTTGIELVRTPYQAPRANALCERFIGSVRRECLDHLLILHERHLKRVLTAYMAYFNDERPHQGLSQAILSQGMVGAATHRSGHVESSPILGGLHHAYRQVA